MEGNFIDRLGNGKSGIALVRYGNNGALDPAFGAGGIATILKESSIGGFSLAMQSDGKFVVAGQTGPTTGSDFLLARLNGSDGSIDAAFGTGGIVTTDFGPTFGVANSLDRANAIAIQTDGKIVAAGSFTNNISGIDDLALARYETDATQPASAPATLSVSVQPGTQMQPQMIESVFRWQPGFENDDEGSVLSTRIAGVHCSTAAAGGLLREVQHLVRLRRTVPASHE